MNLFSSPAASGAPIDPGSWSGGNTLRQQIVADPHGTPIYWLNLQTLARQAQLALQHLPRPFYAVKANSHPAVLQTLLASGMHGFDVASLAELQRVRQLSPDAGCAFMNPFKTAADIRAAWQAGVRLFALDSADELQRLLAATDGGRGCCLLVRFALDASHAQYELNGKFGAAAGDAVTLLQAIAGHGIRAGLTFHVGSQCEDAEQYAHAINAAAQIARQADVPLSVLDIGGGFAARYRGEEPSLAQFGQAVHQAVQLAWPQPGTAPVLHSEPGRSVVANAGSVAVRVEARKGNLLILSDGRHGLLSELWWMRALHPLRRIYRQRCAGSAFDVPLQDFALAGPTCDSGDLFPGPYALPADMATGDWIEIGFLGAYALELATGFNGFGRYRLLTSSTADSAIAELAR